MSLKPSKIACFKCDVVEGHTTRNGSIDWGEEILAQLSEVNAAVRAKSPARLMNIGCDCGTEFAPVAHLLAKHREKLVVFWFDAHAIETPQTSPSGHFHGMVLRALGG